MARLSTLSLLLLFASFPIFSQGWSEIQSDTEIRSLFMVNDQVGYSTRFTSKLKTTDGGKTWTQMEMPYVPGNPQLHLLFNSMLPWTLHFFNRNEGYITGITQDYNLVAKTVDGGTSWSIEYQEARQNGAGYTAMHFFSTTRGIMVGDEGQIIRTTDGVHWQHVPSSTTEDLNQVVFIDQQNGFIFGKNVFLKTTDSGVSWVSEASDYNFSKVTSVILGF